MDAVRISQVLQNLITNAIKFSHENGVINLDITQENSKVIVSVRDSGIGIPKGIMDKLFLKSAKTSRKGTAGETGTGYGLPLAYEITKLHKSTLVCRSEEGKGTTFSFELAVLK